MATEIHDAVQRYYAERIAEESSSCCEGEACSSDLYATALLADLPGDLANQSFGCGDPITIAGLNPGETVLDLGSGAGLDCFLAGRQVGPEGRVIGVDMTSAMIAKAEANRHKLGMANVEFRQGQIEALPVADSSVDVIISNCVISLAPDKLAVFREAYRVLKPGGHISISDIVTEGDFSAAQRARLDLWAACVTGAVDVAEYTGQLEQAGFTNVQIVDRAESGLPRVGDGPRVFSARITGRKPSNAG